MGDHKHNGNCRPEVAAMSKRPEIGATTSLSKVGIKSETVQTTTSQAAACIVSHQASGWRLSQNVPIGGGEILLIFER